MIVLRFIQYLSVIADIAEKQINIQMLHSIIFLKFYVEFQLFISVEFRNINVLFEAFFVKLIRKRIFPIFKNKFLLHTIRFIQSCLTTNDVYK